MSLNFENLRDLFLDALERPSAERDEFLNQACVGDAELRRELTAMLEAHFAGSGPLERGPPETEAADETLSETVGPYKLLQQIGEGGMGVVYMAEQTSPVQRRVALKLIKPGMDSKAVLARFEAERQALALMDHPNIARVFDAGATYEGRPYFVMELVLGTPITKYCDQRHLSPRQRLELFNSVCQGVQHAHQKGVIHRDLKPSNVLVAEYDDRPVPKIIDFGVAKATGPKLTDRTVFTEFGTVVGTLEYMSPEQAKLNALDVDTRTDVYSLGVLLYELLTGSTPFDRARLRQAAFDEVLRIIREEEPPKPSTRLSTTDELPSIAASRGTEPKRLSGLIRGELDWIVMKCLEKDRERRYESANGLAADLLRHLAGEPVQAVPPSSWYRLRKFIRRNRGPVAAAAAITLLLVGGVVGTSAGLAWALRERDAKEGARKDAVANEKDAREAAAAAQRAERMAADRLEQIKRANGVLASIFEDLDPHAVQQEARPLQALLGERLEKAAGELAARGVGDAATAARLRQTLGHSLVNLGRADKALPLLEAAVVEFESALGAEHPEALNAARDAARGQYFAGRYEDAARRFADVLKKQEVHVGAEHPDTLATLNNLGMTYQQMGRQDLAIPILERLAERRKRALGPDHADTLITLNNLGLAYRSAQRNADAIRVLEEVRDLQAKKNAPDSPNSLTQLGNLALAYRDGGRFADAVGLLEQVRDRQTRLLSADHPSTLITQTQLARALAAMGRRDEAFRLLEPAAAQLANKLGADHPRALTAQADLAHEYYRAKRYADAAGQFERLRERLERALGPLHPEMVAFMANYGTSALKSGRPEAAVTILREAVGRWQKIRPDDWRRFTFQTHLGSALLDLKRFPEAEAELLAAHGGLAGRQMLPAPAGTGALDEATEKLAALYDAWDRKDKAAEWRKKLAERKAPTKQP